jgi:MGT family glycosyltransferase
LANFLVAASPVPGHVGPMLNVARMLIGAGHNVVVNTGERFRRQAVATGARFVPLMGGAAIDYQEVAAAPRRMKLQGPEMLRFGIEHVFANPIPDQVHGIEAILREFPADAILTDSIFLGTLAFASRTPEERPILVRCGTTVLTLSDPTIAPFAVGLPPAANERDIERYAAMKLHLKEQFIDFSNAVVNRKLVEAGGAELSSDFLDAMVTEMDLNLQFTVPSFEYPRTAMPENVRFVGAMLPPPTTQFEEPEWWGELESGRPVVVVTQGTVANIDLGHLLGPTLAGLADEDVFVVAATGGPSVDAVPGPKPANARIVDFVPFDKLLPYASVLVTNGGYGAVNHALSLGVPVVGAGKTEDKGEVTARLEWAGVGINLNTATPSPMMVRDAVRRLLVDPGIYTPALEMQAEYAAYDTRRKVLAALDEVTGLGLYGGPREPSVAQPHQRRLWLVGGSR